MMGPKKSCMNEVNIEGPATPNIKSNTAWFMTVIFPLANIRRVETLRIKYCQFLAIFLPINRFGSFRACCKIWRHTVSGRDKLYRSARLPQKQRETGSMEIMVGIKFTYRSMDSPYSPRFYHFTQDGQNHESHHVKATKCNVMS